MKSSSSSQLALDGTVGYRFSGAYANRTQLDQFEARFQFEALILVWGHVGIFAEVENLHK